MTMQKGFGTIAAIVVLVILAGLSAAIVSISTAQQIGSAQDVLSTRAWQAARAGNEWGLFKAINSTTPGDPWKTCPNVAPLLSQTLVLGPETGFNVTVTCESWLYNEGESVPGTAKPIRLYRITAVACPVTTCPDTSTAVVGAGYIERTRVVLATN